jgi:transposase-like protein
VSLAGVTKTVFEASLETGMAAHLGYTKGDRRRSRPASRRNGTAPETGVL